MRSEVTLFGNYVILQDDDFFKLSQDTVLLAHFVRALPGERGIDLGCGTGALGLLCMLSGAGPIDGLDVSEGACALARENYQRCGFGQEAQIFCADWKKLPPAIYGRYDFCVSNPPFFDPARGRVSESEGLSRARAGDLAAFCLGAAKVLRWGGVLHLCCRPDRLSELTRHLSQNRLEVKQLRFVHHNPKKSASLVMVRAKLGAKCGLDVLPPFFVETQSGTKTPEYRSAYHQIER